MEKNTETYTLELENDFRKNFEEHCKVQHRSMASQIRFLMQRDMEDAAQRRDLGDA